MPGQKDGPARGRPILNQITSRFGPALPTAAAPAPVAAAPPPPVAAPASPAPVAAPATPAPVAAPATPPPMLNLVERTGGLRGVVDRRTVDRRGRCTRSAHQADSGG